MKPWASNELYGAGHNNLTGEFTKQDAGKALTGSGLVAGRLPAQHVNQNLYEQSVFLRNIRKLAGKKTEELIEPAAAHAGAVVWVDHLNATLLADEDDYYLLGDTPYAQQVASTSVLHENLAMAYDVTSERIVSVGDNSLPFRYSDNAGASWTTASSTTADCTDVMQVTTAAGIFIGRRLVSSAAISLSPNNGVDWVSRSTNNAADRGIAQSSDTSVVACGDRRYETASNTDSYTSWTDRGLIPDEANADSDGWVSSGTDNVTYFAATYLGTEIRVYKLTSPSGSFELVSSIPFVYSGGDLRILVDRPTNALFVVYFGSTNTSVFVSHNKGITWQGPTVVPVNYVLAKENIRPAGGRLYFVGNPWTRSAIPSPRL